MLSLSTKLLSLILLMLLVSSCQQKREPLVSIESEAAPLFTDDSSRASLLACARTHQDYLASLPVAHQVTIAGTSYSLAWLRQSMTEFISILQETSDMVEINSRIRSGFDIFQATGRTDRKHNTMLVTGYYEPLFSGSLQRKEPYTYPLYSVPTSLVSKNDPKSNHKRVGRIDEHGRFTSYWTRAEIENDNHLAGEELVYLKDPFDAFLLHIQGSGRIQFTDGSQKSVRFAGHNGHTYNSIGKLLVDEDKLSLKETSIPTIRHYFATHPQEQQRILHHNPRFIFFSWGDDMPPRGSLGRSLTAGRSIAIDKMSLPVELFGWLETQKPRVDSNGDILDWVPTARFVLPQDSGAAIKGPGRVDLFWGSGIYAQTAASHMKEDGKLYFLIKKGYTQERPE